MERKPISTPRAPAAVGPYSQAIQAGGLVFCSGQIALDPDSGELSAPDDVRSQTRRVMANLRAVLEAAGSGIDHVVKVTMFIADMRDYGAANEVYGGYFAEGAAPARAAVQVAGLPKGARIMIEAIATA
ncbi:MAG: Rid family detoxifying hydrolase [Myxococcota bacterium]